MATLGSIPTPTSRRFRSASELIVALKPFTATPKISLEDWQKAIDHIQEQENGEVDVYLLSIYDKSDYENISDNFLKEIIEKIQNEVTSAQQDLDDIDENLNDGKGNSGKGNTLWHHYYRID